MAEAAFLNVTRSALGRRWIGPPPEVERRAAAIARAEALPLPVALVLARRGVAPGAGAAFLAPALRDLMPDPLTLRDMEAAAERLARAAATGERIAVFADYDVDGGASAALVLTWLRGLGREATLYIPDRIGEGYGPNAPAMQALGKAHDLILCVDCGTANHEALAAAACDVIVADHHLAGETLPPALAVVNPNRHDDASDLGYLCAAGVVFLLLVAANGRLRARGLAPPDLLPMLDLVALATVADVVPLVGLNRAFVRQGLRVMAPLARPGLAALARVARLDRPPEAWHLGFLFGPRVNAGGRIGAADLGARCLATADTVEAERLARLLDRLNDERRRIEADVLATALAAVEARGDPGALAWAAGEGWHPGVVGIVAARLKEATGRPAVVIGLEGRVGRGSGRSVEGVDLGRAVQRLAAEGLIAKGGGHRMAAGLTVAADRVAPAMERLSELLAAAGAGAGGPQPLELDGLVAPSAATPELVAALEAAGPYGAGAPAPRHAVPDATLRHLRPVGDGHLKLTLEDAAGARLEAIAFRAAGTPLGAFLEARRGLRLHAAGRLGLNRWQGGSRVELTLDDAAPA
jgi:single-stranded-DNA-specific exonuclease